MPHPKLRPELIANLPSLPRRDRPLAAPPIAVRTHLPGDDPVGGPPAVLALFESMSRTVALPLAMRRKLVFERRRHHS